MKKSANALQDLQAAVMKAADELAKEGLFIERIVINSKGECDQYESMVSSFPHKPLYRREVVVTITNQVPNYAGG